VGFSLHGLVDSIFHSYRSGDAFVTHQAPLGHGLEGSAPDYISRDQAIAATGQIISAFETIGGTRFTPAQRAAVMRELNTALDRTEAKTALEVEDVFGRREGFGIEPPPVNYGERRELNFRDVVRQMTPALPNVNIQDLPSPFFRGPITESGTLQEGRVFFNNLPSAEADALTNEALKAAATMTNDYMDTFSDRIAPRVKPTDFFDTRTWSLRQLVPGFFRARNGPTGT
jgi:hypothetical protein